MARAATTVKLVLRAISGGYTEIATIVKLVLRAISGG